MKQVVVRTSTYSSDEFGVCSALYELGGMVVMHDASGCNSTYTTHDEPRWYDKDSMIFISAISEMEAIMGDDEKLITDLMETASSLQPAFIAIVGAPIPYMTGTDFPAIAQIVEEKTGIPSFGFATNGMQPYTNGISDALAAIADRFCTETAEKPAGAVRVNLLGATPLDFPLTGTVQACKDWLTKNQMEPGVCFAMDDGLEDLKKASSAQVNLVLSGGGLRAAEILEERFQIPFVTGVPYGTAFSETLAETLKKTASSGRSQTGYPDRELTASPQEKTRAVLIREAVTGASLAAAIEAEYPELACRVLCPLAQDPSLLRTDDCFAPEEADLIREAEQADLVIADPLYRPLFPKKAFVDFPHTAFSGRIFEKQTPDLIGSLSAIREALRSSTI